MKLFVLGALAFATAHAHATIYVAAYDRATGSIGLAYSSSGGNFWQTRVKGRGLIGAGAYGLCSVATPKKFLEHGDTASAVTDGLHAQCKAVGWEDFRLAAITADGAISTLVAKGGCHVENPECGDRKGRDFAVIGGGLRKGVLEAAVAKWESLPTDRPLTCRLLSVLRAIYAAGGEKKDFKGASITVDDPARASFAHWEARGAKTTLLGQLVNKMNKEGVQCGMD